MYNMKYALKEAGYKSIIKIRNNLYLLTDLNGKEEVWAANKNHASYGIKYKNTHLEFLYSINHDLDRFKDGY